MPTQTEIQCRNAKPKDKAYKLFDGGGLHLWISPKGGKVWRVAYRHEGKQKTISLGAYSLLTLAQARIRLSEIKLSLLSGLDPMSGRREALEERRVAANTLLFKDACTQYWETRSYISETYKTKSIRGIEMHLFPSLGGSL